MKRFFFLAVAATCLMASCNKMETVATGDSHEISFVAVNKTATKAPVAGTTFGNGDTFSVAAYVANGATTNTDFFDGTLFAKEGDNWKGQPARFWPLNDCIINFLAVTEKGGGADCSEVVFGVKGTDNKYTDFVSKAVVRLFGNACANQNDLMFAAGSGSHRKGGSYDPVSLQFKHALSWINFSVRTSTSEGLVTVNSITLNGAAFDGILTITNNNYQSHSVNQTNSLTANWSDYTVSTTGLAVPGASGATASPVTLSSSYEPFGSGLLVIPDQYAKSFTINYTITQDGKTSSTYNYTYDLPEKSETNKWEMAKKYSYLINFNMSEIEVTPSINNWSATTAENVDIR